MSKRRRDETLPSTEMTSMIDIIFQLLIFFLVTLALGTVQERASAKIKGEMKEDLPALPPMERLGDAGQITEGFLLHIDEDKEDKVPGNLAVFILDVQFPTVEDAKSDSLGDHGPYSLKQAKREIASKIETKTMMEGVPPTLNVRAHEDTPYGFVLDIMSICNEDSITSVGFNFAKVRNQEGS